jgi:hypothetical protein
VFLALSVVVLAGAVAESAVIAVVSALADSSASIFSSLSVSSWTGKVVEVPVPAVWALDSAEGAGLLVTKAEEVGVEDAVAGAGWEDEEDRSCSSEVIVVGWAGAGGSTGSVPAAGAGSEEDGFGSAAGGVPLAEVDFGCCSVSSCFGEEEVVVVAVVVVGVVVVFGVVVGDGEVADFAAFGLREKRPVFAGFWSAAAVAAAMAVGGEKEGQEVGGTRGRRTSEPNVQQAPGAPPFVRN